MFSIIICQRLGIIVDWNMLKRFQKLINAIINKRNTVKFVSEKLICKICKWIKGIISNCSKGLDSIKFLGKI